MIVAYELEDKRDILYCPTVAINGNKNIDILYSKDRIKTGKYSTYIKNKNNTLRFKKCATNHDHLQNMRVYLCIKKHTTSNKRILNTV